MGTHSHTSIRPTGLDTPVSSFWPSGISLCRWPPIREGSFLPLSSVSTSTFHDLCPPFFLFLFLCSHPCFWGCGPMPCARVGHCSRGTQGLLAPRHEEGEAFLLLFLFSLWILRLLLLVLFCRFRWLFSDPFAKAASLNSSFLFIDHLDLFVLPGEGEGLRCSGRRRGCRRRTTRTNGRDGRHGVSDLNL